MLKRFLSTAFMLLLVPLAQAAVVDYSESYNYGGSYRIPPPPREQPQEILDIGGEINVGGVLGCQGLNISDMMNNVLGETPDAEALAKSFADNLKSQLAQKTLTAALSNPTIASIQQQMQAFANARLSMMQKKCNAAEARMEANRIMLRDEAQEKCMAEYGPDDERCQQGDKLIEAAEDVLESDRWQDPLHKQICDDENQACDWVVLISNFKADPTGQVDSEELVSEAPIDVKDAQKVGFSAAKQIIGERAAAARESVAEYGYTDSMKIASGMKSLDEDAIDPETGQPLNENVDEPRPGPYTQDNAQQSRSCMQVGLMAGSGFENPPATPDTTGISLQKPVAGDVGIPFGLRINPETGERKFHGGVDFEVEAGADVKAAASGTVLTAHESQDAGNTILLELEDGTILRYYHLAEMQVGAGKKVSAGDVIGRAGSSGHAGGPVLHFEVHTTDGRVDPLPLMGESAISAMEDTQADEEGYINAARYIFPSGTENPDRLNELSNDINAATMRVAQAAECMVTQDIHPHTYIKMGLLPEHIFDSMVTGLGEAIAQRSSALTLDALIFQLSMQLATKGGDEESSMNPQMQKFVRLQIDMLKNMRDVLTDEYDLSREISERIENMVQYRQGLMKGL